MCSIHATQKEEYILTVKNLNHILIFKEPTTQYTKHPFHLILSQLLLARDKGKMRNLLYLSLFIFDFRVST